MTKIVTFRYKIPTVFFLCFLFIFFSFWHCQKALRLLKPKKIIAENSVVSMGESRNRKASDWQFPWQQRNFQAKKMCTLHHQMCQRLVSMTTALWMGKCTLMRFCFKSLLGYFRRKSLPNQYIFLYYFPKKYIVKIRNSICSNIWESNILEYWYYKRGYWRTNNSFGSMSEIKNPKSTDFSNVFTFKFQHLFQRAVPPNVKITTVI